MRQVRVSGRRLRQTAAAALVLVGAAGMVTACSDPGTAPPHTFVIGSSADPAMQVAASIYRGVLRRSGVAVTDPTTIPAATSADPDDQLLRDLGARTVDLFPAFTGSLLGLTNPQATDTAPEAVYDALNKSLPQGVSVGDATLVDNAPHLVVSVTRSTAVGVTSLEDCAKLGPFTLQGPRQIAPGDLAALRTYGCQITGSPTASTDLAPVFAGAAGAFMTGLDQTADPDGTRSVALADPRGLIRAQQLVPVLRSAAFGSDLFKSLNRVAGELTLADLRALGAQVAAGKNPQPLADSWISQHGL